jgi:hypothetical protein
MNLTSHQYLKYIFLLVFIAVIIFVVFAAGTTKPNKILYVYLVSLFVYTFIIGKVSSINWSEQKLTFSSRCMLLCSTCYCGDESKKYISYWRKMDNYAERDGNHFVVGGWGSHHGKQYKKTLLTAYQSPSVYNLDAVKLLLAWSSLLPWRYSSICLSMYLFLQ